MQDNHNPFDDEPIETPEEKKRILINLILKYLFVFLLGIVICFIVVFSSLKGSQRSFFHHLSNGLFVAGVILSGFGILTVISKEGFFDTLQFGFKQLGEGLKFGSSMNRDARVTTDFVSYKAEKRAKRTARWSWVIVGAFFIILSIISLYWV